MKSQLLALALMTAATASQAADFQWPRGAKLAVSLSYDDALNSQLDNALPALNAHGLKATFYLTLASDVVPRRLPEWRAAAVAGHELGNHSLFHACSATGAGKGWTPPHRDLDKIPAANIQQEVVLANQYLHAIDGRTARTMTLPCLEKLAAGVDYVPGIRSEFIAIKSRGGGFTPDVTQADPLDTATEGPEGLSGEQLIARVKQAAAMSHGKSLLSFTFHGIGGEHLSVTKEAHEALLKHLAAHPDVYYVDSFVAIMSRVPVKPR